MNKGFNHNNSAKNQAGFSLVELLVASALGIFLLSAIAQVFTQSRTTVTLNQSVNEIQERGRTLLHHLSFHLEQRGYQGCLPPLALDVTEVDGIDWANDVGVVPKANLLPEAPFSLTALRAFEVTNAGAFAPAPLLSDMRAIEDGSAGVTPRAQSDVIHIQYGDRRSTALAADMNSELDDIEIQGNPLNLAVGDLVMLGDCTAADVFAITNITQDGNTFSLSHGPSLNRSSRLAKPYETNAQLRRFHAFTYLIADTGRDTKASNDVYSLYRIDHGRNAVELADGVEFLQLTYKNATPSGVQDIKANHVNFDSMKIIGIDVGILVVGLKNVLSNDDTKLYRLPGAAIGPDQAADYGRNTLLKSPFRTHVDIKNRA